MAYAEVATLQDGEVLEIVTLDNQEQVDTYAKGIGAAIEAQHVTAAVGVMCLWHNHDESVTECDCMKPENTEMVAAWNMENRTIEVQVMVIDSAAAAKQLLEMILNELNEDDGE